MIYAKKDLNPVHLNTLHSEFTESIFIKIRSRDKNLIFGTCYRPPNQCADDVSKFFDGLNSQFTLLNESSMRDSQIYLMGDFNDRSTSWGIDHFNSELKFKLVNFSEEFKLTQLISTPTRGKYILDLLFTNCPNSLKTVAVKPSFDNLDHDMIHGEISAFLPVNNTPFTRTIRRITAENLQALNTALSLVPW